MKKYCIIGIVVLFAGCELVVDVDVPVETPVLTLNSFMIEDSVWTARLSLSRHILDETDFQPVIDGSVTVYHGDQVIETLTSDGNGLYTGNSRPVPGETYQIRATAAAHGTVRGTSYVPHPVPIESLEVTLPPGDPGQGSFDQKFFIRLRMKDRGGEKNFYQVLAIAHQTWRHPQTGQGWHSQRLLYLNSKDPSIGNDEDVDHAEGIFFKDLLFDGKDITLLLEADYWQILSGEMKIFFYLRTVSEDYYQYKTTALLQNQTSGNPFAQPAGVYDNIENGFGIVGGFSQVVVEYEKK